MDIFLEAVEKHSPDQWDDFLEQKCGLDSDLRNRVSNLLEGHLEQNPLLEADGLFEVQGTERTLERPGTIIGPYKLIEKIGEGGFGVIFMAEQLQPIRRKVALKILKPGLDSRQVIARFEAERQALALMEHPHIASVLDAGLAPSGRPYFVMELVKGLPINEYCDQLKLALHSRLQLFIDLCDAVQHAHMKGIIHRDLKPSNVLVTQCDGKPLVKVIDFGIAKATGQLHLTDKTLVTGFAQVMGTPAYMSPEQAAFSSVDVDTRSDVYSLGVLLYEQLTGTTPFAFENVQSESFDEKLRIIREREPPKPSDCVSTLKTERLATVSEQRQIDPTKFRRRFKGELDWIVMKAIEKDRSRRYPSAMALASDVRSFLVGGHVEACPPSNIYRLRKFARRNRVVLLTSSLVLIALCVGLIVSLWQANQAVTARQLADLARENEKKTRLEAQASAANLRKELYAIRLSDARNAWNDGDLERARATLNGLIPASASEDLREFSWRYMNELCRDEPTTLAVHQSPILSAAMSPDSRLVASADRSGVVKIWDIEENRDVASWQYSNKEVAALAFSPDGMLLASAGQDATVRLWKVSDWTELACFRGHERTINSISWSPDGQWLASGARDNSVRIWNLDTMSEAKCLADNEDVVRCVLWLPDGKKLAASTGKTVRIWRVDGWQPLGEVATHAKGILSLAVSPDGKMLASGSYDSNVILTNIDTQKEIARTKASASVWSIAFMPYGKTLLCGLSNGGPTVWKINEEDVRLDLIRVGIEQSGVNRSLIPYDNGQRVLIASEEGKNVRSWSKKALFGYSIAKFPGDCFAIAVDKDLAICCEPNGTVIVRSYSSDSVRAKLLGQRGPISLAAISKSRKWLATGGDEEVILWDLETFSLYRRFSSTPSAVKQMEFSANEDSLAIASDDPHSLKIWQINGGTLLREFRQETTSSLRIAFSPDGKHFATSGSERGVVLWDNFTGETLHLLGPQQYVRELKFSSDSSLLVAAEDAAGAIVWSIPSQQEVFRLTRHYGKVNQVAISPDGQTLATTGLDNTVRLWHLPSGRELFTLLRNPSFFDWLEFASPTLLCVGAKSDPDSKIEVFRFDAAK